MSQLALDITPYRRIDITIDRLEKSLEQLSEDQQQELAGTWWSVVVTVSRLRAMERAEESVLQRSLATMADAYDRVAKPGEHAVDALLRTFKEVYGDKRPQS